MIFYVVAKIVGFASVFSREVWVEVGVENWHLKSDWWDWGGKGALTCQAPAIRQSWHNCNNPLLLLFLSLPCLPANDIITITLNIIETIWRQRRHSASQPDTSLMSPGQAALLLCQDCCMLNVDCSCDALLNAFMPHKRTGNQLQGALRRR